MIQQQMQHATIEQTNYDDSATNAACYRRTLNERTHFYSLLFEMKELIFDIIGL